MAAIDDQLKTVLTRVTQAREDALQPAPQTRLVAVSKGHNAGAVLPCLQAGHRLFGENRVQEAGAKWPALRDTYPDIELHLIGPLQSNKLREAMDLFEVIETLDREKLALAIAKTGEGERGRLRACFIQVNTGEEDQKAGILPHEADDFIRWCRDDLALPVSGLMCIPPAGDNPAPHFTLLRDMAARHALPNLSMGMSGDFEIAIRFGATHVRVGTAIFGERG